MIGRGDQGGDNVGVELQQFASHQAAQEGLVPGCCPADRGATGRRRHQGHFRPVVLHWEAAHHRIDDASGLVDLQDLLDAGRTPTVTEPLDRALVRRAGGRWAVAPVVPRPPLGKGVRVRHERPHDLGSGSGRPFGFHRQLAHVTCLLDVPTGTYTR